MMVNGVWIPDGADLSPRPSGRVCECGAVCWRMGGDSGCIYLHDPNDPPAPYSAPHYNA